MLRTFRTRRRSALSAGVLATTAGLVVAMAAPSSAATLADWTTGYVPTACSADDGGFVGSDLHLNYTDTVPASALGWSINGRTSTVVLVPGGQPISFQARLKQGCGGVGSGQIYLKYATLSSSGITPLPLAPTTTDASDQTWAYSFTGGIAYAGVYQVPVVIVTKRYDSFVLNTTDFSYVSSVASTANAYISTGAWSTQKVYLLLKTTVSTSASKTTVAAGGSVTFRATLKKAGDTTYGPAAGSKVAFQTKIGTGSWTTRATVTANSTGAVSYTFKPSKTMSWRWVHLGDKTTAYTAPVTSTVKKITVS